MKNIKTLLLNQWKKQFLLSRSIIVITSAMLGNTFAYLFQIISGRYFDIEDYATLVALFSVSGIITLVISFLANGIVKTVSEIKDIDYPDRISSLFFSILKINLIIAFFAIFFFLIFKNQVASYLNIENSNLLIVFGFATGAAAIASQFLPFLQGLQRFKAFSALSVITAFSKFAVAGTVALLGLKLIDTFLGLGITTLLVALAGYLLLKKNIKTKFNTFDKEDLKLVIKYALGGFVALGAINLIQNVDVILVKHFFTKLDAGIYSSVVIIGRIVFFVSAPVGMVMLPIVSEKFKKGENTTKLFATAAGLTTLLAGTVSAIYWLIPGLVIKILFGHKYIVAIDYLPLFSIFMLVFSLLSLISFYFIAISRFKWASTPIIAAILQFIGISIYHNDLYSVIYASIVAVSVGLIVSLIPIIQMGYKKDSNKN